MGVELVLTIHDELIIECSIENAKEVSNRLEYLMKKSAEEMGMDINVPLKVTNSLTDFEKNVVEVKTLREYDFENNPDLRQLDISRLQLQKSLQLQRTQRMPTLAAFSQYGYSGTGSKETMLNFGQVPIQVEASRDWFSQGLIVGLQLRVPLTGIFTNTIKYFFIPRY